MSLINDALKRARQSQQQQATALQQPAASAAPALQPAEYTPAMSEPARGAGKMFLIVPALIVLFVLSGWLLWQWGRSSGQSVAALPESGSAVRSQPADRRTVSPESPVSTGQKPVLERQSDPAPLAVPATSSAVAAASGSAQPARPIEAQPANATVAISAPVPAVVPANVTTTVAPAPVASPAVATPVAPAPVAAPPPASAPRAETAVPAAPVTTPASLPAPAVASTPAPTAAPAPPPEFKVQGIFYRLRNPTAMINGRIVGIGQTVEGYRVVQIERHSVKLAIPGQTNVVSLY